MLAYTLATAGFYFPFLGLPVSYVGFQKILMENLEEIANTWYDKLSK